MKATLLSWAYRLGYRRCLIAARTLTPQPAVTWPDGLSVRPFAAADAEPLRAVGADGLGEFAERLSRGDRPWGVWDGETLVAYGWSTRLETDFSGLWTLRPAPGEAYLHNFFTHPAWRGRGLYPLLLTAIGKALADEGLTRAWIAVVSYNQASWRGVQKAGFALAATYQALGKWGGRLRVMPGQPAPAVARVTQPSHGTPVPARP
jgi:RimJ/RimL family protein N-acetyltransferase